MRCPVCGADNPAPAEYCGVCRRALTSPLPRRKVRRCPSCGARMKQWDTTCSVCGAAVEVVPVPRLALPASALVAVLAFFLLTCAAWAYQPWNFLLAAVPSPTTTQASPVATWTPAASATATAVASLTPTPRVVTITHQVQAGETLASIARKYNTTAEAIMRANQLTSLVIYAGQELRVPVPPAGDPTPTPRRQPVVHIVQPGEYLELIADHYGVTVRAIKDANKLTSDLIHPGQKLVIPVPVSH